MSVGDLSNALLSVEKEYQNQGITLSQKTQEVQQAQTERDAMANEVTPLREKADALQLQLGEFQLTQTKLKDCEEQLGTSQARVKTLEAEVADLQAAHAVALEAARREALKSFALSPAFAKLLADRHDGGWEVVARCVSILYGEGEEQQARLNAFWAKVEAAGEAGLFDLPADHPRAAGCKIPNQAVLNLEVPLCPDVAAAIGVESLTDDQ